jgi:hypothetical protein
MGTTTENLWTEPELRAAFPLGSVTLQIDNDARPLDQDEYDTWIAQAVGTPKPADA